MTGANHITNVVKNHGIPEEHIKMAVGAGKKFFALPTETKMKVSISQHMLMLEKKD